MGNVELLAPAGNYESFIGAINAGADAVYLGGDKFGARAFAENFTTEQLCEAIRYAHLFKRKVYLTLNTLIKEKEFVKLYDYILPFYEAGLDGIIIQDMGVFSFVRRFFPHLPIHVSTQMTVTGVHAAKMLKEEGAVRIVPARELSLREIKEIKDETDLEMETFIHGAMCYCYSGQCLFSSFLGGRSGNRGKCAQPCRLPYEVLAKGENVSAGNGTFGKNKNTAPAESYPLSLKDMCTIKHIPDLIEAGIDSFKIEGRMKKPEYAAGVTAIYRKYIDLYYQKGRAGYRVSEEDMKTLAILYIRSEIQDGYYFRHNGKEMITQGAPGYSGSDENLLGSIRREYLDKSLRLPVQMQAFFHKDQEAVLTISSGEIYVTVTGQVVQRAMKQPITEQNIKDGLCALGDTVFECDSVEIDAQEDIFYPLKAIKDLRREAVKQLEEAVLQENCPELSVREETLTGKEQPEEISEHITEKTMPVVKNRETIGETASEKGNADRGLLRVLITKQEQLQAVLNKEQYIARIYLDSDLCETKQQWQELLGKMEKATKAEIYIVLPYILRKRDAFFLKELAEVLCSAQVAGCMVRNMEGYAFLREQGFTKPICGDANVYQWNRECMTFWTDKLDGFCVPYELNGKEQKVLTRQGQWEQMVYGRVPMMVTANCVAKTTDGCAAVGGKGEGARNGEGWQDGKGKQSGTISQRFIYSLKDRYHTEFPVYTNCRHCYNVIYNSVPLSLHDKVAEYAMAVERDKVAERDKAPVHAKERGSAVALRLDFTTESGAETENIIEYFAALRQKGFGSRPYEQFTTGHEKKGAL